MDFLKKTLFISLFLYFFSLSAHAKIFHPQHYFVHGPLPVRTQNPFFLLFASLPMETTSVLEKGEWSFDLSNAYSNLFEHHLTSTGFGVDIDMELNRTAFRVDYGITPRIQMGLELPFLSTSGGFLDSFVQGYHHAFGFPNGGRDTVDNGRFSYRITRNGKTFYRVSQQGFQVGDLTWHQKFNFVDETKGFPALSLHGVIKLPTGSLNGGSGSRRPDVGLSLIAQKSWRWFHSITQMGFLSFGDNERLAPLVKKGAFVFGQSFEFNLSTPLSFIAQVDVMSSVFKNGVIEELREPICDLTFGIAGEFPLKNNKEKIFTKIGFTEDASSVGPSVDFTLFFDVGLKY